MAARAIVSLGSNIEPRSEYLARAMDALSAMPGTCLFKAGPVEETEPVDVPPEFAGMKFLNRLAIFDTELEVHDFSRRMHAIEDALGRVRTVKNGPRTIDIDLIDFDGLRLDEPGLILPHPRAHEREFIMRPLAELGAIMVSSLLAEKGSAMTASRAIMPRFKELCGATICRDLKGIGTGKVLCSCENCVRNAVRATGEALAKD